MEFSFNTNEKRLRMAGRIAFCLLAVLTIVMALATFAERNHGTDYAMQHYYHAPWCIALWGGLTLFGLLGLLAKKREQHVWPIHLSLVLILAGAALTHFTGKTGRLHLRTDRPTLLYADSEHKGRVGHLPFEVKLKEFKHTECISTKTFLNRLIEGKQFIIQPDGYISVVEIQGETHDIRLNYPLHKNDVQLTQLSYDPDRQGSHLGVTIDPYGKWVALAGGLLMICTFCIRLPERAFNFVTKSIVFVAFLTLLLSPFYWPLLPPVLQTPFFVFHVGLMLFSYLALLGTFVCSLCHFFRPSEALSKHSRNFLRYGVSLLFAGIFAGAYWGNEAWGRYWGWDAKETWALITLLMYLAPLHTESLPFFKKDRIYHLYMVFSFLILLTTFIGVNFLFTGLHSYL